MQIIKHESFKAIPWKNGGGITHEAIRVPSGSEEFRWRVSLATLEAAGPFSNFSGYHRVMVLLQGAGVHLSFGNGQETYLREVGDLVEFDGALSTECELLEGPCVDLNFMAAQSITAVKAGVETVLLAHRIDVPAGQTALIFNLSGSVAIHDSEAAPVTMGVWDLAVTPRGAVRTIELTAADPAMPAAVFCALFTDLDDARL